MYQESRDSKLMAAIGAMLMGVRVVRVEARGYGNALMGGIAASRGCHIIMGDADDSYDFMVSFHIERLSRGVFRSTAIGYGAASGNKAESEN